MVDHFFFLESTSAAHCCMRSVKTSPIVGCAIRNAGLSEQKASICEEIFGFLGRVLEIGQLTYMPKWCLSSRTAAAVGWPPFVSRKNTPKSRVPKSRRLGPNRAQIARGALGETHPMRDTSRVVRTKFSVTSHPALSSALYIMTHINQWCEGVRGVPAHAAKNQNGGCPPCIPYPHPKLHPPAKLRYRARPR